MTNSKATDLKCVILGQICLVQLTGVPCALFVRVTLRKSNTHTQREQLNLNERYRLVDAVVECNLRLVQRKPHSEQVRAMQN